MIGRLSGVIVEKQAPDLLIDVNGVGYEVQMPLTSFYQLPEAGQTTAIYTHFVVREDAQLLYGFANKTERLLFRQLIKANGVGPKLALTILSGMSADQFVNCILNDDATTLVKMPGIGKKTAERLIVEMRDRLRDWGVEMESVAGDTGGQSVAVDTLISASNHIDDAINALVALGYTQAQASKAVKKVNQDNMTSEAIIKEALRAMI